MTLELWSDPATDGERSCCSPQAVTGARALAHRMGIPHLTLDLRERFRAEVVDGFIDGLRRGPHAQPVRALQRRTSASTPCSSWPSASAPRGSPPATTHASRATSAAR